MSGTTVIRMGDRGRLVLPFDTRRRLGVEAGSPLVLIEADRAVLLLTQPELLRRVRADFKGTGLVDSLLEDRRREATAEDSQ
ncbi:MAG: hypothetical protein LBJ62_01170 [Bifidobacteriaceae bacterium]|nr:hypothetical protein [Bifidobacteriaceae bacterium]